MNDIKIDYFIANNTHFAQLTAMRHEFKNVSNNADKEFNATYSDYLKNEYDLNRIKIFCGQYKKEIIGNINLIIVPKSPKPDSKTKYIGYVTNTYVKESFRNCGIGSTLLQMIKEYSKSNDIELLFVWPSEESTNYYERSGFQTNNEIMELIL